MQYKIYPKKGQTRFIVTFYQIIKETNTNSPQTIQQNRREQTLPKSTYKATVISKPNQETTKQKV